MAWNGSDGKKTQKAVAGEARKARRPYAMWAAVIAVVAVAGASLWVFFGGGTPKERAKPEKAAEQKKPAKPIAPRPVKPVPPKKETTYEPMPMPKLSGERIETREAIPAPQSLEEMKEQAEKQAKKKRYPFTNGVEQLIALATPPFPGAKVPPLPPITDEAVAKSLKEAMEHTIVAEEGDSEAVLDKKIVVASAKIEFEELREKEGYGFTEYVNALRDKANADAEFLAEANKVADELYHDAGISDEAYVHYREELNKKLRERGLPEIEKEEDEE